MPHSKFDPSSLTDVTYSVDAGVAVVTLNRPAAMNAVNMSIRKGLVQCCAAAESDPDVRALLIRAEGERAFCVGADVRERKESRAQCDARLFDREVHYTLAIERVRKPVVAAIHGFCLGAGFEISLCSDIRLCSEQAVFALPEVDLGLIPGAGGTQRLSRLIGTGRTMDLVLTAKRITSQTALNFGIVSEVCVDKEHLDRAALKLAGEIAMKPPVAVAFAKEAILRGADTSLPEGLALERDLFAIASNTEDHAEAIDAFKNKRPGKFVGR